MNINNIHINSLKIAMSIMIGQVEIFQYLITQGTISESCKKIQENMEKMMIASNR
jgi:hypothetical protein